MNVTQALAALRALALLIPIILSSARDPAVQGGEG